MAVGTQVSVSAPFRIRGPLAEARRLGLHVKQLILGALVVVFAGAGCGARAVAGGSSAPTAVAGALPGGFRLLSTGGADGDAVHSAVYGRRGTDEAAGRVLIESVRGPADPKAAGADPEVRPGEQSTTVRGRPAVLRTLTDEQRPYAKQLVWREQPDLVVSVTADDPIGAVELSSVAHGVLLIPQSAWTLLLEQSSLAAQIGRVTRDEQRVPAAAGTLGGRPWTLFALIPAHFPLSADDLRVSCYQLIYRHRRGHGSGCGPRPNWQRVGGRVFVFGATQLRHVRVRPFRGRGFDLTVSTRRLGAGPPVRYYATPLPPNACAVSVSAPGQAQSDGSGAGPISGRDERRCAHAFG